MEGFHSPSQISLERTCTKCHAKHLQAREEGVVDEAGNLSRATGGASRATRLQVNKTPRSVPS